MMWLYKRATLRMPHPWRHLDMLLESRSRELADLFRALAAITAADAESSHSGNPVSFEALAESERLLASYFGAFKVGLCILDTGLRYLSINQTLAEMNGMPATDHLGKTVREVLGDFAELIEPQLKRVLANAHPFLIPKIIFFLQTRPN